MKKIKEKWTLSLIFSVDNKLLLEGVADDLKSLHIDYVKIRNSKYKETGSVDIFVLKQPYYCCLDDALTQLFAETFLHFQNLKWLCNQYKGHFLIDVYIPMSYKNLNLVLSKENLKKISMLDADMSIDIT